MSASPYDDALSALREHVDDLEAWLRAGSFVTAVTHPASKRLRASRPAPGFTPRAQGLASHTG